MHGNDRTPPLPTFDKTVIVKLAHMPLWGEGWGEGGLIRKSKHFRRLSEISDRYEVVSV